MGATVCWSFLMWWDLSISLPLTTFFCGKYIFPFYVRVEAQEAYFSCPRSHVVISCNAWLQSLSSTLLSCLSGSQKEKDNFIEINKVDFNLPICVCFVLIMSQYILKVILPSVVILISAVAEPSKTTNYSFL